MVPNLLFGGSSSSTSPTLSPLILKEWRKTFEGNATWKMGRNLFSSQQGGRVSGRGTPRRPELPKQDLEPASGCSGRPKGSGEVEGESLGGNVARVPLTCACQPRSPVLHPRPTSTAVTNLCSEAPPVGTRRAHLLGEAARTVLAFLSLGEGWGRERLKHLPFSATPPTPSKSRFRTHKPR